MHVGGGGYGVIEDVYKKNRGHIWNVYLNFEHFDKIQGKGKDLRSKNWLNFKNSNLRRLGWQNDLSKASVRLRSKKLIGSTTCTTIKVSHLIILPIFSKGCDLDYVHLQPRPWKGSGYSVGKQPQYIFMRSYWWEHFCKISKRWTTKMTKLRYKDTNYC